ncbi:hypothetical protein A3A66_02005 [Microgenomates group bacterium RIFCSPLOWO2_01_FULL_46_13]|nr:MAG: hypothetical protein A2783_01775 [Microgenomates group bacterium RIFCSPHIGHO2_01_FULL_45_11]OGV94753.1 MAG: hypothetical protein A3A66_02005 [Microgenomates group bacterium RIFCSPLOWO2_01_FULL_46_13]
MPGIDNREALRVFISRYKLDENSLTPITHGAWANAYTYERGGQKYIVRLSNARENFDRDALARNYNSPSLPIPEILEIGESSQGFYAISRFVEGDFFEHLGSNQFQRVLPDVVKMFKALRDVDLGATKGYGHWDAQGKGEVESWKRFLLGVNEDGRNSLIHGWRDNLKKSPIGTGDFTRLYEKLQTNVHACPEVRNLVHSDLLNFNFIVKNNRPAAIIDWGSSIYGDSLYEIAWFLFYEPWYPQFREANLTQRILKEYQSDPTTNKANLNLRLACYQLHIGLDSIAYNSFKQNWENAKSTADYTMKIVF